MYKRQVSGIFTHQLRRSTEAILVGTNTAIVDNPRLTTRHVNGPSPLRIVLDRQLRIPPSHQLLCDDQPTWIITTSDSHNIHGVNKTLIKIDEASWNLRFILQEIYKRGVNRLIAEGGAQLLRSLIQDELWEDCYLIRTPHQLGSGIKAPVLTGKEVENYRIIKDKILYISRL